MVPLLLFSVISSITNLGDQVKLHKVGLKSVLFLLLNTLTAAVITLIAALSLGLGKGFQYTVEATEAREVPTAVEAIVGLFPKNIINEWGSNTVVPILIFGLVIALAYNKVVKKDESVKPFKAFVDAANTVLGRAVSFIVSFTPYAVTALIARAVGRSKLEDLLPLLSVLVVAYILAAIQLFGVESLLIALTLLVSIGTVGVPGTATITATALFTAAGLPVELIVLFSPISSIVDMARTATNVVGAATATVLTAETEGLLDHEVYNGKVTEKALETKEASVA